MRILAAREGARRCRDEIRADFGIPAFLAADDVVAFVKDDKILRVDATSPPATVGPSHRMRRDTTYIVAAAVLHCWNGS